MQPVRSAGEGMTTGAGVIRKASRRRQRGRAGPALPLDCRGPAADEFSSSSPTGANVN